MLKADLELLQDERPFAPVGRLIYELLRHEIITVRVLPGAKLNEAKVAKQLEVSRSPVKTALDMLIDEGLLLKDHKNRGAVVSSVDPQDCLQICRARICVEGGAAYHAAKKLTNEQLKNLDDLRHKYQLLLEDEKKIIEAVFTDYAFHTAIVEGSGNPYLIEMYGCIQSRVLRYRCYLKHLKGPHVIREALASRLRCHDAIFLALQNGQSDIAQAEITGDIDGMRDMFTL